MFIVIYSNYCSVSKWTNSLQKTKQKTKKPKKLFYRFNEILLKEYTLYQNYTNFLDDIDYLCSEIVGCRFCFIISIHLWKSMFFSLPTNQLLYFYFLSKQIYKYIQTTGLRFACYYRAMIILIYESLPRIYVAF
jgi:hypothetical protein